MILHKDYYTPLPYSFATNRGTAAKLKFHHVDAPMHSASLNTPDMPRDTVLVSVNKHTITYRTQWKPYHYSQIEYNREYRSTWLTGGSPSMEQHDEFMETVKSLHPMVMQLFSS